MSWHEDICSGLPADADDRAADVRCEIADELSDHLACALAREMTRGAEDEAAARRSVIRRFGDPRRVARRLWVDAMKETIMNQRVAIITNVTLALTCIVICVVTISAVRQNARLNEDLLAKLESISSSGGAAATTSAWAQASVDVGGADSADGPFEIQLKGELYNAGERTSLTETIDAAGRAQFGEVRPGRHLLTVRDPQGAAQTRDIILYPGRETSVTVEWPDATSRAGAVRFAMDATDDVRERLAYAICTFRARNDALDDAAHEGTRWSWPQLQVLVTPSGDAMILDDETHPIPDLELRQVVTGGMRPWRTVTLDDARLDPSRQVTFDANLTYDLELLLLFFRAPDAEAGEFQMVGMWYPDEAIRRRMQGSRDTPPAPYRAEPGRESEWTVSVADGLARSAESLVADYRQGGDGR